MDHNQFWELVNNPCRTQEEIEQMRRNALKKGENEIANIATEALDDRFPGLYL